MPVLPQELFFALLFGAVLLVQFLYKQFRLKVDPVDPLLTEHEPEPGPQTRAAPGETGGNEDETVDEAVPAARPAIPPRLAVKPNPARALPWAPTPARRFSRAALMPDRRAVQDAVVVAAILQPCCAQRARDDG